MDELNILLAQSNLQSTILALSLSIDEIQAKNPQRIDLINSMNKHLDNLKESLIAFKSLESDNRMLIRLNTNYHVETMKLKQENEKLKQVNFDLMQNINL